MIKWNRISSHAKLKRLILLLYKLGILPNFHDYDMSQYHFYVYYARLRDLEVQNGNNLHEEDRLR